MRLPIGTAHRRLGQGELADLDDPSLSRGTASGVAPNPVAAWRSHDSSDTEFDTGLPHHDPDGRAAAAPVAALAVGILGGHR